MNFDGDKISSELRQNGEIEMNNFGDVANAGKSTHMKFDGGDWDSIILNKLKEPGNVEISSFDEYSSNIEMNSQKEIQEMDRKLSKNILSGDSLHKVGSNMEDFSFVNQLHG